ncbi:hypothetical protein FOCC_FOCC004062 [Frankliniella occidentalis]|nr:hypothetical protein FOCC_FOCC004062 [Frankliniella occidentalis]
MSSSDTLEGGCNICGHNTKKEMDTQDNEQDVSCFSPNDREDTSIVEGYLEFLVMAHLLPLPGQIIPLGSILMQSKLTACYVEALAAAQRMCPNFRLLEVVCDFEQAQQAGWAAIYPNAQRKGCYFHHTKDVSETAKELGLRPLVRDGNVADSIVRSLCAVPLLQRENILDAACVKLEYICQNDHIILNSGRNAYVKRRHSALANDDKIRGTTEDLEEGEIDVDDFLRMASRRVQGVYNLILHPNQAFQDIFEDEKTIK